MTNQSLITGKLPPVLLCHFLMTTTASSSQVIKRINSFIIQHHDTTVDPLSHFKKYLSSCDRLFPFSSDLWLHADGSRPSRSFFHRRLKLFFNDDVAGQSMRSGGATSLAENGVAPNLIQAIGCWALSALQIYIRKKLVLLQALLFGRAAHDPPIPPAPPLIP